MQVFETAKALSTELSKIRLAGKTIGLVPTMGNLHEGHLALVEKAKQDCHFVVATIFVNPMQFGADEDFERYPKTLEDDKFKLDSASCDAIFIPSVAEMYPNGLNNQTVVSVPELSLNHCGKSRPRHFDGVCTIVSKLFNLTNPDHAYFGLKDFQQLALIKKMAADLCMPLKIFGVPIQRAESGLALSSRNGYLSKDEKSIAANLYRVLKSVKDKVSKGEFLALENSAKIELENLGMQVDYFTICNAATLEPASGSDKELVVLTAVHLGDTRLIDNIEIFLD